MPETLRPSLLDGESDRVSARPVGAGQRAAADAERRRQTFLRFLARFDVTPTELARRCAMPTANTIYNFLHGRSRSLSQKTIDLILGAFPGSTYTDIVGEFANSSPASSAASGVPDAFRTVPIVTEAQAGQWRSNWRFPESQWQMLPLPTEIATAHAALFAARVREPGAELLHPTGSLLVCSPLQGQPEDLPDGVHVLVRRDRPGKVEVTVRVLQRHGDKLWLWPRSCHPEHQAPYPLPTDGTAQSRRTKLGIISIIGRVIAVWRLDAPVEAD